MADCCPEIKREFLTHVKGAMYEVPTNYKAIVGVYTKAWIQLTEFTKLPPKVIQFDCEIPNELGCLEVAYLEEDKSCADCTCC